MPGVAGSARAAATITSATWPARVAALADGLPVEILRVRRERGDAVATLSADPGDTLDELSPLEVFERRLAQETLTPEQHDGLLARYHQVLADLAESA